MVHGGIGMKAGLEVHGRRALAGLLLFCAAPLAAGEILLFDDFDGPTLETSVWGLADWNIGDRTQFGNQPVFASEVADGGEQVSYVSLPLDTYNPQLPGQRVLGTEIYSLQNFSVGGGVEYVARARLATDFPGLVAAFFTYNQKRQKGRWISDEIDFEVLSKQDKNGLLVSSWNDWGAPGSDYEDGTHHLGAFLYLDDYDWREWNTYAMRWYPDRVEWYVNGAHVRTHSSPVPDQDQPVRASLWAGGTTWPDAYDALLAPVGSPELSDRFTWDVDFILVSRLGDDQPGGEQAPAAPSGLAASVSGSEVRLTWSDNADDETAYTVYRAWKPKGKAAPDFSEIAGLAANATEYTDTVQDGEHLYRVTAANAAGESPPSNTVGVTVGAGGKGGGKPR